MSQGSGSNPVARRTRSPRHSPGAASSTSSTPAPPIPDKLYFRIGEVARLCGVQTSVLRFWETEFPQLHPGKGASGQRLFRRRDVETALRIRHLLYAEGYTIPGARQLLRTAPPPPTPPAPDASQLPFPSVEAAAAPSEPALQARLHALQQELRSLHTLLSRTSTPPRRNRSAANPPRAASLFDPPTPAVH